MELGVFFQLLFVLLGVAVTAYPLEQNQHAELSSLRHSNRSSSDEGEILSVRVTSSVAVRRGRKSGGRRKEKESGRVKYVTERTTRNTNEKAHGATHAVSASERHSVTVLPPPELAGANIEFIKQLRAKKEEKSLDYPHPFHFSLKTNLSQDIQSTEEDRDENSEHLRGRSISSLTSINNLKNNAQTDEAHDREPTSTTKSPPMYSEPAKVWGEPAKVWGEPAKVWGKPAKVWSEPAKVWGEQERVWGEPEKVYGEPAKVYSEPAKVYGEPAKVYSEPAKLYGEPAKVYGEPAKVYGEPAKAYDGPEEPSSSEERDGSSTAATTVSEGEEAPVGYVVEGERYRKYRVEERTPDGFIVGEYGVVSNNDGSLRGVRYTADSDASPQIIHDALLKFLHLKR